MTPLIFGTRFLRTMAAAAVLALLTNPAAAQDDPFALPDAAGASNDPFAFIDQAATPTPANPFDQGAPSTVRNPFDLSTPTPTQAAAPPAPAMVETGEVRGVYVLAADRGYQNPAQMQELMNDLRDGEFTRVYMEARTVLGVSYSSAIEESLPTISPTFPNPLRDLRTRMNGQVRVIAVINVLPAYAAVTGARPPARNPVGRFPDYAMQSLEGRDIAPDNVIHLDPGHPQVVQYLAAIIREVDASVAPDGYLFTGVRYPGRDWGYSEGAINDFRSVVGGSGPPPADDPVWSAWRRDRLTQLLRQLRNAVIATRPGASIGVEIEIEGAAPANYDQYINTTTYRDHMVDWIGWAREGAVNELVFRVHERVGPDNTLRSWVVFGGTNRYNATAVFSLAGYMNFSNQFGRQIETVRSRGLGTLLYHYASPIRDRSRGFYSSLPNVFYKGRPGLFIEGRRLEGPWEERTFSRLFNPPPTVPRATPTATPQFDVLADRPLVFATPSPIPTPSPVPRFVPSEVPRKMVLTSGSEAEVLVLEVTPTMLKIQQVKLRDGQIVERATPMAIDRRLVRSIEPPL